MGISRMHSQVLRDNLSASVHQVYSDTYKRAYSLHYTQGASCISANTKAELAGLAAIKCKFSHLIK